MIQFKYEWCCSSPSPQPFWYQKCCSGEPRGSWFPISHNSKASCSFLDLYFSWLFLLWYMMETFVRTKDDLSCDIWWSVIIFFIRSIPFFSEVLHHESDVTKTSNSVHYKPHSFVFLIRNCINFITSSTLIFRMFPNNRFILLRSKWLSTQIYSVYVFLLYALVW